MRIIRTYLLLPCAALLTACGESHVIVEAAVPEGQPVAGLPVWLLPYDRVAILDSLAADADRPEPGVPPEWVERLEALEAARREVEPGDAEESARIEREHQEILENIEQVRVAHKAWEDTVYAPFGEIVERRVRQTGRNEKADTTDARGRVRIAADEGRWYVWTRYVLPATTLEWSVPLNHHGDSTVVRLTRENARERPFQ